MIHRTWTPAGNALGAALLFGVSTPVLKVLVGNSSPLFLISFLYFGSGIGTAILARFSRSRQDEFSQEAEINRNDIPWLTLAILAGGVTAPFLLVWGLTITSAATASLLLNFEAVATTAIAVALFREEVGRRIWIALGTITLASVLLSWGSPAATGLPGAALVLLACVFWGIDNNATRKIAGKDPLAIVGLKSLGAGVVALMIALLLRDTVPRLSIVVTAVLLGFLCYGVSMILFIRALRNLGAARTGAYFSTAPFIGAAFSMVIFRQAPDLQLVTAAILLLAGTFFLATERHTHYHHHFPLEHEHLHNHPEEHHRHDHEGTVAGTHSHVHRHDPLDHEHPHTPDLHHRHKE